MLNRESSLEHYSCHPKDKEVLTKVRSIFVAAGGTLYPDELEIRDSTSPPMDRDRTTNGSYQLDFDYGNPCRLYTPRGGYVVTGNCVVMNPDRLFELLNEQFEFEIIRPQRDDEKTSHHDLNSQYSGPLVKLNVVETPVPTDKVLYRIRKFLKRV